MAKFKPLSDEELKNQFIKEVKEHLIEIESNLLLLEKGYDDQEKKKTIISQIFRSFHGIKGVSDIVGIDLFSNISHEIETFLDDIRSNEARNINHHNIKSLTNILIEAHDFLASLLNKYKESNPFNEEDQNQSQNLTKSFQELNLNESKSSNNQGKSSSENNGSAFKKMAKEHIEAIKTGVKIILNLKGDYSKEQGIQRTKRSLKFLVKSARHVSASFIIDSANELNVIIKKIEESKSEETTKLVGHFLEKISEIEEYLESHQNETESKNEIKKADAQSSPQFEISESINIKISDIDQIMSDLSDLVILKNSLAHKINKNDNTSNESKDFNSFNKITQSLQEKVLQIRMVPVSRLFGRVPRILRDICKDLQKEVNLEIIGETTKLDCNVIDHLLDPLVHLIRNAVDHGIEKKEERLSKHKPQAGNLTLRAYQKYNNVLIDVFDDGAGLDIQSIKRKAISNKLASQEEVEQMSEKKLIQFIFEAGFSTKEKASKISGRGVGLDIVKDKVIKLGGEIKVNTEKGNGTNFSISVPLTMVMNSLVIVNSNEQYYAIPRERIIENIKFKNHQNALLNFRNEVIPIFSLNKLSNSRHRSGIAENKKKQETAQNICVLDSEVGKFGLAVDSIFDTGEFMIKPLPNLLSNLKSFSGITVLGDGSIVFILEVDYLANQEALMQ